MSKQKDQRQGKPIYKEGEIDVRTSPNDVEEYNLWIGDNYFLLQRGVLEQFVERTPVERLGRALDNYDRTLPVALEESKISPEGLVLILARARIKESETRREYLEKEVSDLRETLAAQHDCD